MKNILSPSYEDATDVLKRDTENCQELYLARDEEENLLAFFMVGWQQFLLMNQEVPAVYLGLSATSYKTKSTGIIRNVYKTFFNEARQWEIDNQRELILWHTTASPSVFYAMDQLLSINEPFADGKYTLYGENITLAICQKKGWLANRSSHPFVLHNIAHNTRYSLDERLRLQQICLSKNFTLFNELGIDESNGDRLLRISRLYYLK